MDTTLLAIVLMYVSIVGLAIGFCGSVVMFLLIAFRLVEI